MKLRLFVAINLAKNEKDRIKRELDKIALLFDFPIKFLDPDNWHLTISFLGYQSQDKITDILDAMRRTASKYESFNINLNNVNYGLIKSFKESKIARMIWLNGDKISSDMISPIKFELEENLVDSGVVFRRDNRPFQTHITLSRFVSKELITLPKIDAIKNLNIEARSLDLMQSNLNHSGAKYELISSFDFKEGL